MDLYKIKSGYLYWKKSFSQRQKYSQYKPFVFYDLVSNYLPLKRDALIIDIGCGNAIFERYLNLSEKYENLELLDGNLKTVNNLKGKFKKVIQYKAPDKLQYSDSTVDFIYCSHLIEHLRPADFYLFLNEINRILAKDGILAISTPMMWKYFYNDIDHIKPYHPDAFLTYLTENRTENIYYKTISSNYEVLELVYRFFTSIDMNNGYGSSIKFIDFIMQSFKMLLKKLKIYRYTCNGYTLILKKNVLNP